MRAAEEEAQKARRSTTRYLLTSISFLLLVAAGLGLYLSRHTLGFAHKRGASPGAPGAVQPESVVAPPLSLAPPWSYPHGRETPVRMAPPSYPPLVPRYPPAFTAFDVGSAIVFHSPPPLPSSTATFQQSFVRCVCVCCPCVRG